jgi:hypothetical protein
MDGGLIIELVNEVSVPRKGKVHVGRGVLFAILN